MSVLEKQSFPDPEVSPVYMHNEQRLDENRQLVVDVYVVHHLVDIPRQPSQWELFRDRMRDAGYRVVKQLKGLPTDTKHTAEHIIGETKHNAENVGYAVRERAHETKEGIKKHIFDVEHKAENVVGGIRKRVGNLVGGMEEGVEQEAENLRDKIRDGEEKARDYVKKMVDKLEERQDAEADRFRTKSTRAQQSVEENVAQIIHGEKSPTVRHDFSSLEHAIGREMGHLKNYWLGGKDSDITSRLSLGNPGITHIPLAAVYGSLFCLYLVLLQLRIWKVRKHAKVFQGDGTAELLNAKLVANANANGVTQADKVAGIEKIERTERMSRAIGKSGRIETIKKSEETIPIMLSQIQSSIKPAIVGLSSFDHLRSLVEALNCYAATVPAAFLLLVLLEFRNLPTYVLHYLHLTLLMGSFLSTEFSVGISPFNLGRREIGQYMIWGVMGLAATKLMIASVV